jgi:hypothetical protein
VRVFFFFLLPDRMEQEENPPSPAKAGEGQIAAREVPLRLHPHHPQP